MLKTATSLLAGALLGVLIATFALPGDHSLLRETKGVPITAEGVGRFLQNIPLRVVANAIATGDRVIPADDPGAQMVPNNARQSLLFVRAQLNYGIDSAAVQVSTDETKKVVTLNLPSPHLLNVTDPVDHLEFVYGEPSDAASKAMENEAVAFVHRQGANRRYVDAAKEICVSHLKSIATAFGYSTSIIWTDAPIAPQQQSHSGPM